MKPIVRIFGVGAVFAVATAGWLVLGETMRHRTGDQTRKLNGDVSQLWGQPIEQKAPSFVFHYNTEKKEFSHREGKGPHKEDVYHTRKVPHELRRMPNSTDLRVHLDLDQRTRGLIWYSLFNVRFGGTWTYTHRHARSGELDIRFQLPHAQALYDDFTFVVDGVDHAAAAVPRDGAVNHTLKVSPGQTVTLGITYASRGLDSWRFLPGQGVTNLEKFRLALTTDFADIDFPKETLSPSSKQRKGDGWALTWRFKRVITGHGIGMIMPQHIQPGELATALSFSAPVSLFFFFAVILLLATLRKIEIHPVNYLLLAAAFFAFHLLFSYLVDHIYVIPAFAISSVVSIVLVVSYLRLVVSARFAFIEAALAQLVYLIGFSLAHFWEGYTGLTVTVLVILTLFLVMQLTGRLKWSEVLRSSPPPRWDPGPPTGGSGGAPGGGGPGGTGASQGQPWQYPYPGPVNPAPAQQTATAPIPATGHPPAGHPRPTAWYPGPG